jgi:hypothetical protein
LDSATQGRFVAYFALMPNRKLIELSGQSLTVEEWGAQRAGLKVSTLRSHLKSGWTLD